MAKRVKVGEPLDDLEVRVEWSETELAMAKAEQAKAEAGLTKAKAALVKADAELVKAKRDAALGWTKNLILIVATIVIGLYFLGTPLLAMLAGESAVAAAGVLWGAPFVVWLVFVVVLYAVGKPGLIQKVMKAMMTRQGDKEDGEDDDDE